MGVAPLLAQYPRQREIAITIDDLPAGAAYSMTGAEINEMTAKVLGTRHDQKVPVVGFVNEKRPCKLGEVDERINALLQDGSSDRAYSIADEYVGEEGSSCWIIGPSPAGSRQGALPCFHSG